MSAPTPPDDGLFARPDGRAPGVPAPVAPAGDMAPTGHGVPAGHAHPGTPGRDDLLGYADQTYHAAGWQPPRPRTEPLAAWSVPAGVVLGPVGVGLGAAALSRTRSRGTRGRGLAWTGVALGTATTLAWCAGVAVVTTTARAWEPVGADLAAPRDVAAVQLVLGSCVADVPDPGAGADVASVRAVPCADPHTAQVVARTDMADDEPWPGAERVAARTARVCGPQELGAAAQDGADDLAFVVWTPSEASWAQGDRTGLCLAVAGAPRTGSLLD